MVTQTVIHNPPHVVSRHDDTHNTVVHLQIVQNFYRSHGLNVWR